MSANPPPDAIYSPPDGFVESLLHHAGTPRSQYPEPPQPEIGQSVQQAPAPASTTPQTPSEPKTRLRKACDSCSTRKVKVKSRHIVISSYRMVKVTNKSFTDINRVVSSATNLDHHVAPVPPSKFHVHSSVPVADEDLQTDMPKL